MENRTTSNTYLKFIDSEGATSIVSIDSIVYSGHPIDKETGDDLDLYDSNMVDINGNPV